MNKNSIYYKQVKLLIRLLPLVDKEKVFALKGGTAINLFVRDCPRLSVDIDLAYLPLEPREEALANVKTSLQRITDEANKQPDITAKFQDNKADELRIIVFNTDATIKIEVSPVARGTLYQAENKTVTEFVEDEFGYAEIQVVSLPDLYGGKICAAMDRQHPRDLFDVHLLLHAEGISREIFVGFMTYALGHPRPLNEVMSPNWQPLEDKYHQEFSGMTIDTIELQQLLDTRQAMMDALKIKFTTKDRDFLLSFKQGEPNWTLFDEPSVADLPAIRWKQVNINKLKQRNPQKHQALLAKLEQVLAQWLD